ncbi:MAG: VCBS repeat-containing protein [Polyangiaceae bacterium]
MVKQLRLGRATGLVALGLFSALSLPRNANAAALFSDATVGSLGVPQTACADTGDLGCNTNWFELADLDQDGDFDIVMANGGGVFAPAGAPEESVLYLNDGHGAFFNATTQKLAGAHSQSRQVAVGDVNGDGFLDLLQPSGYGTDLDMLWIRNPIASGVVFADQAATNLPAGQMSHAASAHFGDLDGDGDLDLVIADWGNGAADAVSRLILYSNDGTGVFTLVETQKDAATPTDHFPSVIPATPSAPYYGARPTDLDFVDVDGDFDLDILVNHRDGFSRIFLNDGHANFTDGTNFSGTLPENITANYPPKQGPYAYNQEACDLDEDGDLDLILDNAGKTPDGAPNGNGTNVTQVLINDGHGVFTDDTANRVFGEPASLDSSVKCADVNGDGHYDIVVGSRVSTSEKVLLNDGTGKFSYATGAVPAFTNTTIAIDVGDLDGDGKLDLVTGQGEGTITAGNTATLRNNRVYLNIGAADSTPPVFRKIETPAPAVGVPTVFRVAVRDSATNEAGQMATVSAPYTIKGVTKQAKVAFIGGDLFRVVIPAQVAGTVVTVTPTAVDRAKLSTSATPLVLTIGAPPVTGEGGAGGDTTDVPGAAGSTEPTADAGSAGEPTSAGGSSGNSGGGGSAGKASAGSSSGGKGGALISGGSDSGGQADEDAGEAGSSPSKPSSSDDGCSCSVLPATHSRSSALLGFGLGLLGLVRRRRNTKK